MRYLSLAIAAAALATDGRWLWRKRRRLEWGIMTALLICGTTLVFIFDLGLPVPSILKILIEMLGPASDNLHHILS